VDIRAAKAYHDWAGSFSDCTGDDASVLKNGSLMIQPERITLRNRETARCGKYVLYWMQAAQRAEYNHALEYAIEWANEMNQPVVVVFALTSDFPEANERHYRFMLEGLQEVRQALSDKGIRMVVLAGSPAECVPRVAQEACLLVMDAGHLRIQRRWRAEVAGRVACPCCEVETNLIVPAEEAAEKENFSAGTFRPRIHRQFDRYLAKLRHHKPRVDSLHLDMDGLDLGDIDRVIDELRVDRSVGGVSSYHGGTKEAKRRLNHFLDRKLSDFAERRNDPNAGVVSDLSPYLHFGQISPLYIALRVREASGQGKEAYLEELIVRRELSFNFVHYCGKYDDFESLPPWAKRTLNYHSRDQREYVYSLEEFEAAQTHDPYWNAAQREMVLTGKMHGYMRMYWGKKILEWTGKPQDGFKIALHLNNKYELDGRDPNGFAGVAWCFGKHDRAWGERPVFGKIRYMNAAGLKRKFDPEAYVKKIEALEAGKE
jgi:deoxyribodipyrimidine photo-lyase